MKRFFALLIACMLFVTAACAEDYTVAEKLYKQLWAGSGFSGTLSVEIDSPAFQTSRPVTLNADYIYVREAEGVIPEHRLDLTLLDGEKATSAAYLQLREGTLSFQADVLSPDWFAFSTAAHTATAAEKLAQAADQTGAPALSQLLLAGAAAVRDNTELANALEPYLTRIDLWIEGYRQDAVLSKLDEETTVMQVHYLLTPAAIKAQVKQLVVDVLNDEKLLPLLAQEMTEEQAALYLNPVLQNWYFDAVDALPFPGDLTLSRTLALTGETLELHLSLPMYDAQAGVVTLSYDRTQGAGDLPDENVIRLESADKVIALTWQEYSSMTGVQVMQGTLTSQPVQDFSVDETTSQTIAVGFTLKRSVSETMDQEGRDVYTCDYALTLAPQEGSDLTFEETELSMSAQFISKPVKSAATGVTAQLSVAKGDTSVSLRFDGASRKKWEPEAVPQGTLITGWTDEAVAALLPGAAIRGLAVLSGFLAEAPAE